jgi:hypothetical protein
MTFFFLFFVGSSQLHVIVINLFSLSFIYLFTFLFFFFLSFLFKQHNGGTPKLQFAIHCANTRSDPNTDLKAVGGAWALSKASVLVCRHCAVASRTASHVCSCGAILDHWVSLDVASDWIWIA